MSRPSIALQHGALIAGVNYGQEFRFLIAQTTCAGSMNYLADIVEDVFFDTMTKQSMPLSRSNWSLLEAGLARAFTFHMAVVTGAPMVVIMVVLVYLDRMRSRLVIPHPCLVHGLVPERLLLGAWILAFQSLYGVPNNRSEVWADAAKLFSPVEVEQTINEIGRVLGEDLSFTESDMQVHCGKLVGLYESWTEWRVRDAPREDVGNRPFNQGLLSDQGPVPGISLTGGVQRRSVRLVCRSTASRR